MLRSTLSVLLLSLSALALGACTKEEPSSDDDKDTSGDESGDSTNKKVSATRGSGGFFTEDTRRPAILRTYDMKGDPVRSLNILNFFTPFSQSDFATDSDNVWTDGAVVEPGFQVDALEIPGQPFDGAESDAGWTFDGFRTTTGSETQSCLKANLHEYRNYTRVDRSVKTGPWVGWLSSAV